MASAQNGAKVIKSAQTEQGSKVRTEQGSESLLKTERGSRRPLKTEEGHDVKSDPDAKAIQM